MKLSIKAGATSQTVNVFFQDSSKTTGVGLAGLTYASTGLTCYYVYPQAASAAITLATLAAATSAWATGGFKEIDSTNCPGLYRFDIPNAAIAAASGRFVTIYFQGATNLAPCVLEIELTGWDNQDGVHGGLTSLPNVASGSAGAIPTTGTGSNQINVSGGRADANVTYIAGTLSPAVAGYMGIDWGHVTNANATVSLSNTSILSASSVTSVTTVTGNVNGSVGGAISGNVGGVSGVTFPATVASPTNITAGTITTVTNLTNAPTAGDFTAAMKTSLNAATPASVQNISAQTGDSYARLGAPAGVTVSADIAVLKTYLPFPDRLNQTGLAWVSAAAGNIVVNPAGLPTWAVNEMNGWKVQVTDATGNHFQERTVISTSNSFGNLAISIDHNWTTNPVSGWLTYLVPDNTPALNGSLYVTASTVTGSVGSVVAGVTVVGTVTVGGQTVSIYTNAIDFDPAFVAYTVTSYAAGPPATVTLHYSNALLAGVGCILSLFDGTTYQNRVITAVSYPDGSHTTYTVDQAYATNPTGWTVIGTFLDRAAALNASLQPAASNLPTDYQQRAVAVTLPANPPAGFLVTASYGTAPAWNTGGTDPLASTVPGSYASGTAGYALGRLGSGIIVTAVPNPAPNLSVTLVRGADYNATDGTALQWTDSTNSWPVLTGAAITLSLYSSFAPGAAAVLTQAGTVITPTGSSKTVQVALTAAQTAALQVGAYHFNLTALLADSHTAALVAATANVK